MNAIKDEDGLRSNFLYNKFIKNHKRIDRRLF